VGQLNEYQYLNGGYGLIWQDVLHFQVNTRGVMTSYFQDGGNDDDVRPPLAEAASTGCPLARRTV